jgi:hypothetical protein
MMLDNFGEQVLAALRARRPEDEPPRCNVSAERRLAVMKHWAELEQARAAELEFDNWLLDQLLEMTKEKEP